MSNRSLSCERVLSKRRLS